MLVLVFYCCVLRYHKLRGLKQNRFIISYFHWLEVRAGSAVLSAHKAKVEMSLSLGSHLKVQIFGRSWYHAALGLLSVNWGPFSAFKGTCVLSRPVPSIFQLTMAPRGLMPRISLLLEIENTLLFKNWCDEFKPS